MISVSNRTYCLRLLQCCCTLSEAGSGSWGTFDLWVQALKVPELGTTQVAGLHWWYHAGACMHICVQGSHQLVGTTGQPPSHMIAHL